MNYIFTDIDGVLNTINRTKWNQYSIELYNKVCLEFDLKPVISSTWRTNHSINQLQTIFIQNGLEVEIYDYTPFLNEPRGLEIESWLHKNLNPIEDKWVVLDDSVRDITPYLNNVVKCRGWLGFTEDEYELVRKFFI
jgi:hypothetical protein